MYAVKCWIDLERFGVQYLTGEACGLGRRVLCDVTEVASIAIFDMMGLNYGPLQKPWNGGSKIHGGPKVGAVMIPRSILPELAVWLMRAHDVEEIIIYDGVVYGREPSDTDEEWEKAVKYCDRMCASANKNIPKPEFLGHTCYRELRVERVLSSNHHGKGERNTHAMSGRTE